MFATFVTQLVVAQSSYEAEYIRCHRSNEGSEVHPVSVLGLWTTHEHPFALRWNRWSGKQDRFAASPSCGRAISVVGHHQSCRQTFAPVLSDE